MVLLQAMDKQYTYFLILGASLAGPLALSFDKKVAFFKRWKYLFPAMIIPALLYILWDMQFTKIGVWSFNEQYITGIKIGNLPVEEVLFFFIVPYCCVFVYDCLRIYFPQIKNRQFGNYILQLLSIILLIAGLIFYRKAYTQWTFILTAFFIQCLLFAKLFFKGFDSSSFLISYVVIVMPFLIVNGFLTAIPVVLYNDAENLGVRIYTIPFEDVFYGMLLVMMIIALYEKLQAKQSTFSR